MTPADLKFTPDSSPTATGRLSTAPPSQTFLKNNPDCAALVRDLEAIADQARSLFDIRTRRRRLDGIQDNSNTRHCDDDLTIPKPLELHPQNGFFAVSREGWAIHVRQLRLPPRFISLNIRAHPYN
jgi:hypothetical protein